ncbi:RNA polymerase sigma factor [Streptomyces sp. NPDC059957]|uniref:RNA polymerase sigma factor n=1 Tax=unclassified Streptomyces TaxID=2593676 RepID=UPI003651A8EF
MTQQRIPEQTQGQVAELWDREAAGLLRFALVRTQNDKSASEDLVQRVFMAAALAWDEVGGRDPEGRRGWLRRTCRNMWVDDVRRDVRWKELEPDLTRLYQHDCPDPADAVIARDELDRCWDVVRGLPPVSMQVALLYFFEQQSAMYIAQVLGIGQSQVRKHVANARKVLRQAVGRGLDEDLTEIAALQERKEKRA